MTSDEFRELFNRDRMMPVTLLDGQQTIAVGLNGEQVILFRAGEMPLAWFKPNPLDGGIFQHRMEAGPFDLPDPRPLRLHTFDLSRVAEPDRAD